MSRAGQIVRERQRLRDLCAVALAVGQHPSEVAEQYGIDRAELDEWLTQDEGFITQVNEFRRQTVQSGQNTAFARVTSDAPSNVARLIQLRDNPRMSPHIQLGAAKTLVQLLAVGSNALGAPPVPKLNRNTVRSFIEALAFEQGKEPDDVAQAYNLSLVDATREGSTDSLNGAGESEEVYEVKGTGGEQ